MSTTGVSQSTPLRQLARGIVSHTGYWCEYCSIHWSDVFLYITIFGRNYITLPTII